MLILNKIARYKYDLLLLATYIVIVILMKYYYPVAQVSWDSNYYVDIAMNLRPCIRPIGYPVFLIFLHSIQPAMAFVVFIQYVLYFLSVYYFLRVLSKIFNLEGLIFYIIGVLLLLEPTGLYYSNNILSDELTSAFTLTAITTLIVFLRTQNFIYLLIHAILIYCCIELRHTALFYPFFSALVVFFFARNKIVKLAGPVLFGLVFYIVFTTNVERNREYYGVPVYSAFTGWTDAANALYILPRIDIEPKDIAVPDISDMHRYLTEYMDTTSLRIYKASAEYIWNERSPLTVLRQKAEDSLNTALDRWGNFYHSMYIVAPSFGRWGSYIKKHFPYEYLMGFVVPVFKTMINPHNGEMGDYYVAATMDKPQREWYNMSNDDFKCRENIFRDKINYWNSIYYKLRILLFLAAICTLWYYRKNIKPEQRNTLLVMSGFIVIFYLAMLYSSWFVYRHVLPLLHMATAIICIMTVYILRLRYAAAKNTSEK